MSVLKQGMLSCTPRLQQLIFVSPREVLQEQPWIQLRMLCLSINQGIICIDEHFTSFNLEDRVCPLRSCMTRGHHMQTSMRMNVLTAVCTRTLIIVHWTPSCSWSSPLVPIWHKVLKQQQMQHSFQCSSAVWTASGIKLELGQLFGHTACVMVAINRLLKICSYVNFNHMIFAGQVLWGARSCCGFAINGLGCVELRTSDAGCLLHAACKLDDSIAAANFRHACEQHNTVKSCCSLSHCYPGPAFV